MKFTLQAQSTLELARKFSECIQPDRFPKALSYFVFEDLGEGKFEVVLVPKTYTDEMLFMDEVSCRIATRKIYGFISFLNDELVLGLRGISSIVEFIWQDDQWVLREFEDFKLRERSWVEMRLEISSSWEELQSYLSRGS